MITEQAIMDIERQIERQIEKAILDNGQKEVHVVYSVGDCQHVNNLDQVAAKGNIVLVADPDDFFGGEKSKPYKSPILKDPTWLEIAVCANAMMKKVKDYHHCFLENIRKVKTETIKGKTVDFYRFVMGS